MIPSVISALNNFANTSYPIRFVSFSISYKPFIPFMTMTNVTNIDSELSGIVDYASALTFELRQPASGGDPYVQLNFKNGTADL